MQPLQHQNNFLEIAGWFRKQVWYACKMLVNLRLDSGPFGNVSMRLPGSDIFCVNAEGVTFDQLELKDILCVDIAGNVLDSGKCPHPGTFIHREIYRLRGDVNAIVHTHSHNTVLMSLLGCTIEPFTQVGAAIYGDQGIYHGFSGPVRTTDEGGAIASALEDKSIVIAKNHGVFTTGQTMPSALWDMVVTDLAAGIHLDARRLGLVHADNMSVSDLQKSRIEVRHKQCDAMWNSYMKKIDDAQFPSGTV